MIEYRIAEVLTERFKEEDLSGCFLVDVKSHKNNKVEVFVDADDQLTIEMCRKISRFIEHNIEENAWLPEKYTLDVSSSGIDNPLRLHRQYVKNINRNISILFTDGSKINGQLMKVEELSIAIKSDKKDEIIILFENIKEAKILVSFKKK